MTTITTPIRAGYVTPESDNARVQPGVEGIKGQDSNTAILAEQDAERKVFLTLRAKLALAGKFGLFELAGGDYLVTLSGYTKSLPDLRAVAAFLRQVSGGA